MAGGMRMNDRQMKQAMKKMGIKQYSIDDVTEVVIRTKDKEIVIPTDLAIINIGISADLEDLRRWDMELTKEGLVKVGFDMSTNRPGIFACGDAVAYDGKVKQITTAMGEATTAVIMAHKFVKKPYWA